MNKPRIAKCFTATGFIVKYDDYSHITEENERDEFPINDIIYICNCIVDDLDLKNLSEEELIKVIQEIDEGVHNKDSHLQKKCNCGFIETIKTITENDEMIEDYLEWLDDPQGENFGIQNIQDQGKPFSFRASDAFWPNLDETAFRKTENTKKARRESLPR